MSAPAGLQAAAFRKDATVSDWWTVSPRIVLVTLLLVAVIFTVDVLLFPVGVALGVLYVLPILVSLRSRQRTFVFAVAAGTSLLTVLGYLLSPTGGVPWMALVNRGLAVLAIWVIAVLSLQQRKAEELIQFLRGLLPMCASCKKVRDDKGYWRQVEQYIETHSNAMFTHSICPTCVEKWYPDLYPELVERYPELYKKPEQPGLTG
jgi:hypothetical protein